jgi:hypothetical protein
MDVDSFWDDGKDSKSGGSGLTTVLLLVVFGVLGVSFFWKFIVFGEMEIRKTLKVDGNVGIGTTTLTEKLTVNGNVSATRLVTPGPGAVTTNVKVGTGSGAALTTGAHNILIGSSAGTLLTTGGQNVAIGNGALANHTGLQFTAVGHEAGLFYNNPAGSANVFLGHSAGRGVTTGNANTHVGYGAGFAQASGNNNTFIGNATVLNTASPLTGSDNTTVGNSAGVRIGAGAQRNTLIGQNAGSSLTTGSSNVMLGTSANVAGAFGTVGGFVSQATLLGADASISAPTGNVSNITAVGSGATVPSNTSNYVRIGNASVTAIVGQVDFTFPSDIRDKEEVREVDGEKALQAILSAKPVHFVLKDRRRTHEDDHLQSIGFIAQQVEEIEEALDAQDFCLVDTTNPEQMAMTGGHMIPLLVKAIQELAARMGVQPTLQIPLRSRTGYGYEENQPWTPPVVTQSEDTEYLIPSLNKN